MDPTCRSPTFVPLLHRLRRATDSALAHLRSRGAPRKLAIIAVVTLVFAVYHLIFHRHDVEETMGSASPLSALLFALNLSTGVGGFWQPSSPGARGAAVVQILLLMLLVW